MEFSYKVFEEEFSKSMEGLEQAFREKDHLKTIRYLRFLAGAYYEINYKLTDDRLEEITQQISLDLLGETKITYSKPEKVIFYDGFGLAERGLADIYVTALNQLGYKVIWIMHCNAPDLNVILQRYAEWRNVSFCIIPKCPILERMKHLQTLIAENKPRHLFLYTKPFDICGIGVFSTIRGDVTKYLIDLADHVFWLGKCAFDYVFASRGYINVNYRNIAPEKILGISIYPNSRMEYPFEGMPFDLEKYEYVFSGGSPYKILGDPTYQEIVEYILMRYPELKFVYAGNGTNRVLNYLEETYSGQFFHINERKDLDAILQRAKLYLGTSPINGGLMIQYPIVNGCPQLCFCHEKNSAMDPATFLLHPEKVDFVFYTKEDLLLELDKLLQDKQYYDEKKHMLQDQDYVIDAESFKIKLQSGMTGGSEKSPQNWTPIKMDSFLKIYKNTATYEVFCNLIYRKKNLQIL